MRGGSVSDDGRAELQKAALELLALYALRDAGGDRMLARDILAERTNNLIDDILTADAQHQVLLEMATTIARRHGADSADVAAVIRKAAEAGDEKAVEFLPRLKALQAGLKKRELRDEIFRSAAR